MPCFRRAATIPPTRAADERGGLLSTSRGTCEAYIAWLNGKVTGQPYRLLSEAEWEYACRAGKDTSFWWGSSITPEQANYNGNYVYAGGGSKGAYREKTMPVESFQPNPWGSIRCMAMSGSGARIAGTKATRTSPIA